MTHIPDPRGSPRSHPPQCRFALAAIVACVVAGADAPAQSPQASSPASDPASAASAEVSGSPAAALDVPQSQQSPAAERAGNRRRHGPHRPFTGGVDATVQSMARTLDLDAAQQARLRQILQEEQRLILQVRSEHSGPQADRVGPVLAILDRTRDQVRAMLRENQQMKYQASVPRDHLAPANADVEHWLSVTRPKDP
jgi:hypothetical protein